jgi:hypothetical protein
MRKGERVGRRETTPILDATRQVHHHAVAERATTGLGEVLAGTSYEYAVGHIFGTPSLVSGPSLKVDNL